MHLFDVLDVASHGNFVGGFDQAHIGEDAKMPHLFHDMRDLSVHRGRQPGLIPVIQLSGVIDKLHHEWRVLPIEFLFRDLAHKALAELATGQGTVDEGRRLLGLKGEHALASANHVVAGVLCLWVVERVLVTVLLLVLPSGLICVVFSFIKLIISLIHAL